VQMVEVLIVGKVLVTGAAGFIGSAICERLLSKGYQVLGIDSFDNYYLPSIKEQNLRLCRQNFRFQLIAADLVDLDFSKILAGVDYVFHLAARPGVRAPVAAAPLYWRNNIQGTLAVLEAVKGQPVKKFVFASTSSVYGEAVRLPVQEGDATRPVSLYGISKLAAEKLCLLYAKNFQIPLVILRYFSVYGPRQRPDMAFDRFIRAILKGKKLIVYGDGRQTRDFTYISDVVDGSIRAMLSEVHGEIFNIGGGTQISVQEAISLLEELTGKRADLTFVSALKCEPKSTMADISKARRLLGYRPVVPVKKGLVRQLNYIKNYNLVR